jgi:hypothetical protein
METFLTRSGYHNEHHVENLASIFFIFTPIEGKVEILDAIWLHDASKKNIGQLCFGGQKTIFWCRYGLPDLKFLFVVELGTCVQNLIFTKGVEGCQKNYFPRRGMQKFTYNGHFLTIKIAYEKFLD